MKLERETNLEHSLGRLHSDKGQAGRRLTLWPIIKILVTNQRFSMGLPSGQSTNICALVLQNCANCMQHVAAGRGGMAVCVRVCVSVSWFFSGDMCSTLHSIAGDSEYLRLLALPLPLPPSLCERIWPGFQLVWHAAFIGLLHQLDRQKAIESIRSVASLSQAFEACGNFITTTCSSSYSSPSPHLPPAIHPLHFICNIQLTFSQSISRHFLPYLATHTHNAVGTSISTSI